MSFKNAFLGALGLLTSLWVGCSSPTSTAPPAPAAGAAVTASEPVYGLADPASNADEEFDCTHLEQVYVRFSSPGYLNGNHAGLYVNYEGIPEGEKLLRIWWDNANDQVHYQDLRLGQGDPRNDQRWDIERLVEHVYPAVTEPVTRLVRTELILVGKTGNCPRNRWIVVEPNTSGPVDNGSPSPSPPIQLCAGYRFCNLGDGTVRDNVTGLVWLRNPGCFVFQRWQDATDGVAAIGTGHCGLTDGSSPGSWRLPTVAELQSVLDARFHNPALSNGPGTAQWIEGDPFTGVVPVFYWTSELVQDCIGQATGAWVVSLGNGADVCRPIGIGFALFWPIRSP
jgi:hypothetical protein